MKISNQVLSILDRSTADGSTLLLPPGQLARPLYEEVNKVIVAAGGKWNRKAKGHVFDGLAADAIEPVLLTGEVTSKKQEFGQFDTPPEVALRAAVLCRIGKGMRVLEPNAGNGALVRAAAVSGGNMFGYEIDGKRHERLTRETTGYSPLGGDFLAARPFQEFDRVLMNPPFSKQADIRHVNHAVKFLKPGGRLVAIMSASVEFRGNGLAVDFRERVLAVYRGSIERLPDDSFKSSGTAVSTVLVSFDVPRED